MNFWTPTWDDWGSGRDDSTMPWYAKYDFVETYDWNQDNDTFTLRWRDDFDGALDETRWYRSENWTFDSNSSTFMKNHVYTEDGNLVLKMDKTLSPEPPAPEPPAPEPEEPEECEASEYMPDYNTISFGRPCNRNHDRSPCTDCTNFNCYQSWDSYDPNGFLGNSGQCRCLPDALTQPAEDYTYGVKALKNFEGQCRKKCTECRFSWPQDDPLQWQSENLEARCMPALSVPKDPTWDYNNTDYSDPYA